MQQFKMAKGLDVDKALRSLGHWYNCSSKWHIRLYFLGNTVFFFASVHMMAIVFVGINPATHHCKVPEGTKPSDVIPPDPDDSEKLDHCSHYLNFSTLYNASVRGCPHGWEYSDEVYSIVHEWDAVCDDAYKVSTSQTILIGGFLLGAFVVSPVIDRLGRKRVMLWSVLVVSILGFCVAWVKHYWLFCLLRFGIGFMQQGIIMAGFIYQCELFPLTDRTVACLLSQMFWPVGMFLLDLFAYFIRQWGNLMIAISVPGVLIIPLFWIIPESVPFLVAKGRLREAKEVLQAAAKMNGVTLPTECDLSPEDEMLLNAGLTDVPKPNVSTRRRSSVANAVYTARRSSVGLAVRRMSRAPLPPDGVVHDYSGIDIFKSKRLLAFALIMTYLWCTSALVYYGLSLNIGSLAGDPYLNFFLSGLVEIPAACVSAAAMQLVGRRWPLVVFHLVAGVSLFITIFIPEVTEDGTNLKPLIITLSMIGKFGITACFGCVFMYAPELFPTTIRATGLGIASIGARCGGVIAPFTPLVGAIIPWLPSAIFAMMCVLGAILMLVLPETLGRPLPQTIREVEQWTRNLTAEEKQKYRDSKKADKAYENQMRLDVLKEEDSDSN